jgi:hypothetical protein
MVRDFLSSVSARPGRALSGNVGKDTATTRTLRRALATIGSEEHLAAALDIVARGGLQHHVRR